MAKPAGQIQLNASHALAANVAGFAVCENDGTVRELIGNTTVGPKATGVIGGDVGLADGAYGLLLGQDAVAGISSAGFSGNGEFTFVYFGGLNTNGDVFGYGESSTGTGGPYNLRITKTNWNTSTASPQLRGGWSGQGPKSNGRWSTGNITPVLRGYSTTITAGVFSTNFYENGINEANSASGINSSYDPPRSGQNTYLNLIGKSDEIILYIVVFNKALNDGEWSALNSDPWAIVEAAGGAANVTERLCAVEFLSEKTFSYGLPVASGRLMQDIAACPVENMLELSRSDLLAVSYQLNRVFTRELITETLAGISAENTMHVAHGRFVSFDHIVPVEWSGAVVVEFAHDVPVEWTALVAQTHVLPVGHMSDVQASHSVPVSSLRDNVTEHILPVAWSGAVVVEFAHDVPVEWTAEFADMKSAPVENMVLVISEAALPVEQMAQIAQEKNIVAEFIMNVEARHILPVEWQGVDGFISGISNVFKNFGVAGVKFAGRGRSTIFPKRKG